MTLAAATLNAAAPALRLVDADWMSPGEVATDDLSNQLLHAARLRGLIAGLPELAGDPAGLPEGLFDHLADAVRGLDLRRSRGETGAEAPASLPELWEPLIAQGWAVVPVALSPLHTRLVAVRVHRARALAQRRLTRDERDVLARVARGETNKEIAYDAGVAEATIASRLFRAQQRLGISSRTDVIRWMGGAAAGRHIDAERFRLGGLEVLLLDVVDHEPALDELTPSEREVALMVFQGCSDKEIAAARDASPRTVANQLRAILRKLEVSSRYELAVLVRDAA